MSLFLLALNHFTPTCLACKSDNLFDELINDQSSHPKVHNCGNDFIVAMGNIILFASPEDGDSITISDGIDIIEGFAESDELREFVRREQIYAHIGRAISSHNTKWIPYQWPTTHTDESNRNTVDSAERI